MRWLVRLFLNAVAILVAARMVNGLEISGTGAALLAGALLGLVNVAVRPVLLVLTLPFTLITLGLFIFVVNAVCLWLTSLLVPGFTIHGLWPALLGALVVSIVSWILNGLLLPSGGPSRRN